MRKGDNVQGTTKIEVTQGEALSVASASFDPGYSLDVTLAAGYVKKDALKMGYCDYGKAIGEGSSGGKD